MTDTTPSQPRPIWPGTLCASCAYDLGGLLSSANCPECNTPIAQSLQADLIQVAPLDYLLALRNAIRIIIGCIFAFMLFMLITVTAMIIAFFISVQQLNTPGGQQFSMSVQMAFQAINALRLIANLLLLYALWLFTTPHPVWKQTGLDPSSRRSLRVLSIIYILSQIAAAVPAFLNPTSALSHMANSAVATIHTASVVTYVASFVTGILLVIFFPLYAKTLATRLKEPGTASFANNLTWLLPVLITIGACVLYLGPIIALILTLILLFQLHNPINAIIASRRHAAPSNTPDLA